MSQIKTFFPQHKPVCRLGVLSFPVKLHLSFNLILPYRPDPILNKLPQFSQQTNQSRAIHETDYSPVLITR